jgi:hypothetical protein
MTATRTTQINITRLTPNRSASRPTIGDATANITPLIDKKPEISSRLQWKFGAERFEKEPKSIKHSRGAENEGQQGDSNDLPSPFPFMAWALGVERFSARPCNPGSSICHKTPISFSFSERAAPVTTRSTGTFGTQRLLRFFAIPWHRLRVIDRVKGNRDSCASHWLDRQHLAKSSGGA